MVASRKAEIDNPFKDVRVLGEICLSDGLALPILKELVPGGFGYGINLVAEFEPQSIWYEASLTIAAHALKGGIRTDYHTFQHIPNEVTDALSRLGVNVKKLQEEDLLRITDSYTAQAGLSEVEKPERSGYPYATQSLKLSDWSIAVAQKIKAGIREADKRRLHIDDNTYILARYNKENEIIDFWRTRVIPQARAQELAFLHAVVTGVASESFYRQLESLADGIIEFRSEDKGGEIGQYVRVRSMRGKQHDSRWHRLQLLDNGEVKFVN